MSAAAYASFTSGVPATSYQRETRVHVRPRFTCRTIGLLAIRSHATGTNCRPDPATQALPRTLDLLRSPSHNAVYEVTA